MNKNSLTSEPNKDSPPEQWMLYHIRSAYYNMYYMDKTSQAGIFTLADGKRFSFKLKKLKNKKDLKK